MPQIGQQRAGLSHRDLAAVDARHLPGFACQTGNFVAAANQIWMAVGPGGSYVLAMAPTVAARAAMIALMVIGGPETSGGRIGAEGA